MIHNSTFYIGVVENRHDPMKLGRCQVRVVGLHTHDKIILPTGDLPWAYPMQSVNSAAINGIGESPLGPVEGSSVVVMFFDPPHNQQGVIIGCLGGITQDVRVNIGPPIINDPKIMTAMRTGDAVIGPDHDPGDPILKHDEGDTAYKKQAEHKSGEGITVGFQDPHKKYPLSKLVKEPDTNRLARGTIKGTVVTPKEKQRDKKVPKAIRMGEFEQPKVPYGAEYPFNHVRETESGHVQEFDDTPGYERIHTYHRAGTYQEIDANGSMITKIVGDRYEIWDRNGNIHVKGDINLTIDGYVNVFCQSNADIQVQGDARMEVNGNYDIAVAKDMSITVGQKLSVSAKSGIHQQTSSGFFTTASSGIHLRGGSGVHADAGVIHLNSGTSSSASPKQWWVGAGSAKNPNIPYLKVPTKVPD